MFSRRRTSKNAPIALRDGVLHPHAEGTLFVGRDGRTILFQGVRAKLGGTLPNSSFQYGGCIRIGRGWQPTYTLWHFAHEYGHWLQRRELGFWRFQWLALRSFLSAAWELLRHSHRHFDRRYERDATTRGMRYVAHELVRTPR